MIIRVLEVCMRRGIHRRLELGESHIVICGTGMYDDRVGVPDPAAKVCCQWKHVGWKDGIRWSEQDAVRISGNEG